MSISVNGASTAGCDTSLSRIDLAGGVDDFSIATNAFIEQTATPCAPTLRHRRSSTEQ